MTRVEQEIKIDYNLIVTSRKKVQGQSVQPKYCAKTFTQNKDERKMKDEGLKRYQLSVS